MAWNALTQMQPLMRAAGMRELDERGSDLALAHWLREALGEETMTRLWQT